MYGAQKYNMQSVTPPTGAATAMAGKAVVTHPGPGRFDADNPAVWLVGLGAVTLGLVAFSTHVKVGSFSATVAGGK